MQLQQYDINYSIPPVGLYNSGILCYLNTTIQTLLSVPIFNKMIHDEKYENNKLVLEFRNLYNDIKKYKDTRIYNLNIYFKSLVGTPIIDGMQNDSFEILKFILELLPVDFYNIFYLKYYLIIKCSNCNKVTNVNTQNELTVNLSLKETPDGKVLDNDKNINDYIKCNINILEDYKCEKCNKKNTSIQFYKIGNIPNSIIISYHDNHENILRHKQRGIRHFPEQLNFTTKLKSNIVYIPVAHVKHYGHLHGGHYNGDFLRNNTYLQDKIIRIQNKMQTLTNKVQINNYKKYLTELKDKKNVSIYDINDSRFSEISNFTKSQNTYYVVYVLVSIK